MEKTGRAVYTQTTIPRWSFCNRLLADEIDRKSVTILKEDSIIAGKHNEVYRLLLKDIDRSFGDSFAPSVGSK